MGTAFIGCGRGRSRSLHSRGWAGRLLACVSPRAHLLACMCWLCAPRYVGLLTGMRPHAWSVSVDERDQTGNITGRRARDSMCAPPPPPLLTLAPCPLTDVAWFTVLEPRVGLLGRCLFA
jgi:hypothetical protein